MDRQLYRSRGNKVLAGVCGGIGEYFRVDPVILRILWLVVAPAGGIFVYIIAAFLIPERPKMEFYDNDTAERDYGFHVNPQRNKLFIGGALVFVGAMFALKEIFHWFDQKLFWPVVLVIAGLALIFGGRRRDF